MFLDISVKDLVNYVEQNITYNEIVIERKDLLTIPKLMQYFSDNHIHLENEIRLDSFPIYMQNEIGLLFFEFYGLYIYYDNTPYFDSKKFKELFASNEILISYFDRADRLSPSPKEGLTNILIFTTDQINDLLLNFFSLNFRNFKSAEKDIVSTINLYDIDLNKGEFSKITNKTDFLLLMFDRYIRTSKGSIPFSNNFGSSIKASLQRKADFFTQRILEEEIKDFTTTLSTIYKEDFNFISLVYETKGEIDVHIVVYITLQAARESPVNVKVVF